MNIHRLTALPDRPLVRYLFRMPLRFSRHFKIAPGIRLNVSKSGVSTSVGTRGAWFTFGTKGTRATVGIPGTGISYTETHSANHSAPAAPPHLQPLAQPTRTLPPDNLGEFVPTQSASDWNGLIAAVVIGAVLGLVWMLVR